jgi:hypothetical protein
VCRIFVEASRIVGRRCSVASSGEDPRKQGDSRL